jgi:putative ABC transport system permease protein
MTRSQRITRDVLATLLANRGRAVLMGLALVVGVGTLSAVVAVGQGTRARVMEAVQRHGMDMIMVRSGGAVQVFAPRADQGIAGLTEGDARAIEAEIPGVVMASAVQNQRGFDVVAGDRSVTTRVFGVEPQWLEIRRWGVAEGDFFSDADLTSLSRVAFLGHGVARELFPGGGAVGQTIRVANEPYEVRGVAIEMGASAGGDDWDDRIVIPFTTSSRRLFGRPHLEQIVIRVSDAGRVDATAERIRELLRVRHGIAAGMEDDFFVREPEAVEDAALDPARTLSALLVALAMMALLAGGLVVMNTMLTAVSQRAHEIGLRRALGARAEDISRQFLLETGLVAVVAALVGAVLGVLVAGVLGVAGVAAVRITWLPFVLSVVACVAIALVFGTHPARKAARIDPAVTLREGRT